MNLTIQGNVRRMAWFMIVSLAIIFGFNPVADPCYRFGTHPPPKTSCVPIFQFNPGRS
jgi:hypothetical protein